MICSKSFRRFIMISKHIKGAKSAVPATASMHLERCFSSARFADDDVLFDRIGGAGIITLNRPGALNALNLNMIKKIFPKIKEWEEDPTTTMIIMKGAGGKAFCAGGDIRTITDEGSKGNFEAGQEFFRSEYQLNYRIATCLVPYIAFIDGITMGGGVGLSVHGENRVCTERTLFAMPETAIGLFPDVGGSYFLPRLSKHLGMYLALTGYRLKGRDVYKAGVATRMVHSSVLPELERDLVAMSNPSTQDITNLLRKYHEECKTGRERDYLILRDKEEAIKRLFCAGSVEEIFQNLKEDGSEWALEQLHVMKKMSPTSLKITHKQLSLGESMDLSECLEMEYRMASQCLRHPDFYEGVRAVLIDKDKSPKWNPATIPEVTNDLIDSHFVLPSDGQELEL
uniref:3-hydroxyisobutyryl-CoA hydrolase, mitochondrial n=1 Tax=Ciona savignyi TaxID=51511 RepID=H2ZC72_CIOSA